MHRQICWGSDVEGSISNIHRSRRDSILERVVNMIFAEVLGRSGRLASSWAFMLCPCSRMHAAFRTSCNLPELLPISRVVHSITKFAAGARMSSWNRSSLPEILRTRCIASCRCTIWFVRTPSRGRRHARHGLSLVAVSRLVRLSWQDRVLRQGPGRARGRETRDVPDQATAGH